MNRYATSLLSLRPEMVIEKSTSAEDDYQALLSYFSKGEWKAPAWGFAACKRLWKMGLLERKGAYYCKVKGY